MFYHRVSSLETYGYPSPSFVMVSRNAFIFHLNSVRTAISAPNTCLCLISIFGQTVTIIQPVYIWFIVTEKWPEQHKYWCIFDSFVSSKKNISFGIITISSISNACFYLSALSFFLLVFQKIRTTGFVPLL